MNDLIVSCKGFKLMTIKDLTRPFLEEGVKSTWLVVDDKKKIGREKATTSYQMDEHMDGIGLS